MHTELRHADCKGLAERLVKVNPVLSSGTHTSASLLDAVSLAHLDPGLQLPTGMLMFARLTSASGQAAIRANKRLAVDTVISSVCI